MAEQQVEKSHPVIDQFKRRDISREETAKLYSTWAKDYDKDIADLSYFSPSNDAAELENLLGEKKDALILDVCCGTGLAGQELSKRGFHNLHGLDASKEMLEQASQKGVYKKLINATVGTNRVDIANDTYDAVIMSGGVGCGHVNAGGLAEMIRLVKPGGYVVMDSIDKYTHGSEYGDKSWDEMIDSHIVAGRWVTVTRRRVDLTYNTLGGVQYSFQVK